VLKPENKECRYCGLPLLRKAGELLHNFKARIYHDRACHTADRVRAGKYERSQPRTKERPKVNDPFAGFMEPLALEPFSEPSAVVIQIPEEYREAVIKQVGIRNMRGALT
jgi:uncharacterized Zn finger protein (UPF0148 family)